MVNDTFAICANTYIKEANRYSMPNINNAQNRGVALNMANENRVINSIMSSGTGDAVMSDITGRTKEYKHLIDYGLDAKVANRLDEIFKTGLYHYLLIQIIRAIIIIQKYVLFLNKLFDE